MSYDTVANEKTILQGFRKLDTGIQTLIVWAVIIIGVAWAIAASEISGRLAPRLPEPILSTEQMIVQATNNCVSLLRENIKSAASRKLYALEHTAASSLGQNMTVVLSPEQVDVTVCQQLHQSLQLLLQEHKS